MGRFVTKVSALALTLGAPGLFLIAFLDSSFLSLPEVADLLVVWMVTHHKARMLLYVASTALGSLGGCLILYYIGRKGGQALVRKRFAGPTVERTLATFQRYGVMAVLVPSLLPPPAPFKIFVLVAGIAGISGSRFLTAIAIGRGIRYFGEGALAVRYGDSATTFLRENGATVSLWLVGVLVAGLLAYVVWSKVRPARQG
jgi:membrane protein YqaA with SNARE-associated domain